MEKRYVQHAVEPAYNNEDFLHSDAARPVRILAEYLSPERQLRERQIRNTIIVFGSARIRSAEQFQYEYSVLKKHLEQANDGDRPDVERRINKLKKQWEMTQYYNDTVDLCGMLTDWSKKLPHHKRFVICSGGGSGIMEAANRGATISGGDSIGMNISLPYEQFPNPYITPDLHFEFHYFFMRKFWFASLAKAMIVCPGGFGTLDELMEILTLRQTNKLPGHLPVVLYGSKFWKKTLNFEYLVEMGLIEEHDLSLYRICDTPCDAFKFLTEQLTELHHLQTDDAPGFSAQKSEQ
ncbi:LOG family protein [Ignavibacteria bacterium]|jgi:uncharacterized protein (TIGR00730 family)|nr:LOG family protein [Bacteroidota bacterium]MCZ2133400.1 LOG family protein [Bacteroidota bacterium]